MNFTNTTGSHDLLLGFIGNVSGANLILILFLVLILFGAKKIPEFAKGLGSGVREFKKATKEISDCGDDIKAASSSEPSSAEKPVESDKESA
jgi:sec-independent protein translocase protein TatA